MIWQIRTSHKYKTRESITVNESVSEYKLKDETKIRGEHFFFRVCTFILTFVKWKQNQQNFISTHKN